MGALKLPCDLWAEPTMKSSLLMITVNLQNPITNEKKEWRLPEGHSLSDMTIAGGTRFQKKNSDRSILVHWRAIGLVEHIGSYNGGHYITWALHQEERHWVRCDDSRDPIVVGSRDTFIHPRSVGSDTTFMAGITMILFQRISRYNN